MVEFKVVVNDTKKGVSHQVQVSGHHANSLIGKKIGDEVDGIFISLPGYKLQITGGTDKNGFAMRSDFPGMARRRLLLSNSKGFNAQEKGIRKKKSIRGNTVNQDVVQINMKVTKYSSRPIEKLIEAKEKSKTDEKEKPEEKPKEKPEEKPEEKVEEKPEEKVEEKPEEKVEEKVEEETKKEATPEEPKEEKKEEIKEDK
jgi:small subunit ribosomal protein S6e